MLAMTGYIKIDFLVYQRLLGGLLCVMLLSSCSTSVLLPEVDIAAPGWTVWSGQALWKAAAERPAIAGEIVLARHDNGDVLINFAKPPVPIFTAQSSGANWKIDFIYNQNTYSGTDGAPSRFVWFRIPSLLQSAIVPKGWQVQVAHKPVWELLDPHSGEHIRLVLDR